MTALKTAPPPRTQRPGARDNSGTLNTTLPPRMPCPSLWNDGAGLKTTPPSWTWQPGAWDDSGTFNTTSRLAPSDLGLEQWQRPQCHTPTSHAMSQPSRWQHLRLEHGDLGFETTVAPSIQHLRLTSGDLVLETKMTPSIWHPRFKCHSLGFKTMEPGWKQYLHLKHGTL
jgi:hypothetical protein